MDNTAGSRLRIVATKIASGIGFGLKEKLHLSDGYADEVTPRINVFCLDGRILLGKGGESGDGVAEYGYSGVYVLIGVVCNSWGLSSRIRV